MWSISLLLLHENASFVFYRPRNANKQKYIISHEPMVFFVTSGYLLVDPARICICNSSAPLHPAFKTIFSWIPSEPLSSIAPCHSYPTQPHPTRVSVGRVKLIAAPRARHNTSDYHQLYICTCIYTGSECNYAVTHYLWVNWLLTDYGWHWQYRLWDADLRNSYGEYLSFRSSEDHSFTWTVELYRIDPGCEPRYRQRPHISVRTADNTQQISAG